MTKHTPGPWKVVDCRTDEERRLGMGMMQIQGDECGICEVEFRGSYSKEWCDESESNARLIAAAPELLDAIKIFLQFFDDMPKGQLGKIVCDIGILNDAFIKSGEAIAKAETGK